MSPLTKLFVVLNVVLSLLLTAGTVVFVNQVEDFKHTNDVQKAQVNKLQAANSELETQVAAAQTREQSTVSELNTQVEAAKQRVNEIQGGALQKDADLAQLKTQLAIQSADVTRMGEALKASEDTKAHLLQQVGDLRGSNDKLVAQNASLNQTVTDLTNKYEVVQRDLKFVSEQLTEAKTTADKQGAMLRDAGINQQQLASYTAPATGAPAISGVVRAVRPIAGIPYATISVGSADQVAKGMQFKVVGGDNGQFLGVLTVDSVELNEATGRLQGPKVGDIKAGSQVKTQL